MLHSHIAVFLSLKINEKSFLKCLKWQFFFFKATSQEHREGGEKDGGEHIREAGPQKLCKTQEGRHVGSTTQLEAGPQPLLCVWSWASRRECDVGKQSFTLGLGTGQGRRRKS